MHFISVVLVANCSRPTRLLPQWEIRSFERADFAEEGLHVSTEDKKQQRKSYPEVYVIGGPRLAVTLPTSKPSIPLQGIRAHSYIHLMSQSHVF